MAGATYRAESACNNPTTQSPNLRLAISAAMRRHDIPPSRFDRDAMNDPRFVQDLWNGRAIRPATEARARVYIASLEGR